MDPAFAKSQLLLLLREWYMHSNGQIPAYEWSFGDVPPGPPYGSSRSTAAGWSALVVDLILTLPR